MVGVAALKLIRRLFLVWLQVLLLQVSAGSSLAARGVAAHLTRNWLQKTTSCSLIPAVF